MVARIRTLALVTVMVALLLVSPAAANNEVGPQTVLDVEFLGEVIVPTGTLFDGTENVTDFQCAWDGFLSRGRLNPAVAATMEEVFLNAIRQLNTNLRHRKKRFIEYFTVILGYYATDPINNCIPALFENDDAEIRKIFASSIRQQLHRMSEHQQKEWWDRWLKQYWENRLQSVPAPLDDGEIETMLDWLPHLTSVFSEAVELAIQMPKAQLQQSLLICQLTESNLIKILL